MIGEPRIDGAIAAARQYVDETNRARTPAEIAEVDQIRQGMLDNLPGLDDPRDPVALRGMIVGLGLAVIASAPRPVGGIVATLAAVADRYDELTEAGR